MTCECIT